MLTEFMTFAKATGSSPDSLLLNKAQVEFFEFSFPCQLWHQKLDWLGMLACLLFQNCRTNDVGCSVTHIAGLLSICLRHLIHAL